jgi:hypothetical protein
VSDADAVFADSLVLQPDEVLVWEQGHPDCPAAWIMQRASGACRVWLKPSAIKAVASRRRLLSLGTPAEAGVPAMTTYASVVYVLNDQESPSRHVTERAAGRAVEE